MHAATIHHLNHKEQESNQNHLASQPNQHWSLHTLTFFMWVQNGIYKTTLKPKTEGQSIYRFVHPSSSSRSHHRSRQQCWVNQSGHHIHCHSDCIQSTVVPHLSSEKCWPWYTNYNSSVHTPTHTHHGMCIIILSHTHTHTHTHTHQVHLSRPHFNYPNREETKILSTITQQP